MTRHVYELRLWEYVNNSLEEKSVYVITKAPRDDGQLLAIYRAQHPTDKRKFSFSRDESQGPAPIAVER